MEKQIWVLTSPDNGHYDPNFVKTEIDRLCKLWDVKATSTTNTRDSGHGQERLYIVSGEPEAISEFEKELDVALY